MPLDTERIEQRRRELGLTQEQAARKAGLPGRAYWNDIVNGRKCNITLEVLDAIAKALQLNSKELIR